MDRIYVLSTVEQFPIIDGNRLPWRSLQIAKALKTDSNEIHLLTSTFNHYTKQKRKSNRNREFKDQTGISINLIPSISYSRNVGLIRIFNYVFQTIYLVGFFILKKRKTDKIIVTVPAIEHLLLVILFKFNKSVIDYRDLWPDIFKDEKVGFLKGILRDLLVRIYNFILGVAIKKCNFLVTITDGFKQHLEYKFSGLRSQSKCLVMGQIKPIKQDFDYTTSINNSNIRLVYAGLLSKRTGSVSILENILEVYADQIYELSVCGHGDALNECEKLERTNKKFKFYGSLEQNELLELYSLSDYGIVAYPNTQDFSISYPNKVWEYLAYGLPFIHIGLDSISNNEEFKKVGCVCVGEPISKVLTHNKIKAVNFAETEYKKNIKALEVIKNSLLQ